MLDKDDPQEPTSSAEVQYTEPEDLLEAVELEKSSPPEPATDASVQYTEPPE